LKIEKTIADTAPKSQIMHHWGLFKKKSLISIVCGKIYFFWIFSKFFSDRFQKGQN